MQHFGSATMFLAAAAVAALLFTLRAAAASAAICRPQSSQPAAGAACNDACRGVSVQDTGNSPANGPSAARVGGKVDEVCKGAAITGV